MPRIIEVYPGNGWIAHPGDKIGLYVKVHTDVDYKGVYYYAKFWVTGVKTGTKIVDGSRSKRIYWTGGICSKRTVWWDYTFIMPDEDVNLHAEVYAYNHFTGENVWRGSVDWKLLSRLPPGHLEIHARVEEKEVIASLNIYSSSPGCPPHLTGTTPWSRDVPNGTYTIIARYEPASPPEQSKSVTVVGYTRVNFDFAAPPPPPGPPGKLECHAYIDSFDVGADVVIEEIWKHYTTPFIVDLYPGDYVLNATYEGQTVKESFRIESEKTTRVDIRFVAPILVDVWPYWLLSSVGALAPIMVAGGAIIANEFSKLKFRPFLGGS